MIMSGFRKTVKKAVRYINKIWWRILASGKIECNIGDGRYKIYRFLGINIYAEKIILKNIECGHQINNKTTPVFYLKINRDAPYTLECIQMWLDIVHKMKADYYIVCDNKWLETKVLKKCRFHDKHIRFIPSYSYQIRHIAEKLYTGGWKYATYAHLTPFYHASKMGYRCFWTIDADDTSFLLPCQKMAGVLKKVENYSLNYDISANSLDMWFSRTRGKHWSFGVTFINNNVDFQSIFESNKSKIWMNKYEDIEDSFNLDWFFTYLKQYRKIKICSFAVNHAWFIHWGNFIINPLYGWINCWEDRKIHYPILENIYQNQELGCIDSLADLSIDVDTFTEEAISILENQICKSRYFETKQRRLFSNYSFASDKQYYRF